MPLGIPNSWRVFKKMPQAGIFKCTYVCAPEDRNFRFRSQMFETYGNWSIGDTKYDEVMWWSGLFEAPEAVIDYLEFLVSSYDTIWPAFKLIDGVGGNGNI